MKLQEKALKFFLITVSLIVGVLLGLQLTRTSEEDKLVAQINKSLQKTVSITINFKDVDLHRTMFGSGVFISPNGYILTTKHIFKYNNQIVKIEMPIFIELSSGEIIAGELVKVSPKFDLALIKTWSLKNNPYAKLENPNNLKIGQIVYAIGDPFGFKFSVTKGILSQLYVDFSSNYNLNQSDVAINLGNSGGPLFNSLGKLVGINIGLYNRFSKSYCGLTFSVQSGQCMEFLVWCAKEIPELRSQPWK